MASLRMAMDAGFWDLDVATPQSLEGAARSVPAEPAPLGLARASRSLRPQQLSFLSSALPLGIVPSFAPAASQKTDLGSFSIQSILPGPSASNWWTTIVGQFRPGKLITNIKKEVTIGDEFELPQFQDIAKHFLDKSLYALGVFSQFALTPETSLLFNVEGNGDRKGCRTKALLWHQLPNHDLTLQAASPDLFLDSKGTYWNVPSTLSLNLSSLMSISGLRYRFGLHNNGGQPEALNSSSGVVPLSLMPGICAKAAFSYENRKYLWREKEKGDTARMFDRPTQSSSYDQLLQEPHAAISGIFGGSCSAWYARGKNVDHSLGSQAESQVGPGVKLNSKNRNSLNADLYGSLCCTFQHGKFKDDYNDLTRLDARLDIHSASAFIKGTGHLISDAMKGRVEREVNPLASPRLNFILRQQLAGPIMFRVDSRVSFDSPSGKHIPHLEDVMYGLSYSFRLLQSGKVLAWFSPKRKEAMIELRLLEL